MRRNLKISMLQRTIYNNHHNILSYFLQRYIFFYIPPSKNTCYTVKYSFLSTKEFTNNKGVKFHYKGKRLIYYLLIILFLTDIFFYIPPSKNTCYTVKYSFLSTKEFTNNKGVKFHYKGKRLIYYLLIILFLTDFLYTAKQIRKR